jgi:5-oxoprolinase (ATP-hydrolysing)
MPGIHAERPLKISIGEFPSFRCQFGECLTGSDRGGTFTDCVCRVQGQEDIVVKILSVDTRNYPDAPTEAIRRVLERFYATPIPRGTELDLKDVGG